MRTAIPLRRISWCHVMDGSCLVVRVGRKLLRLQADGTADAVEWVKAIEGARVRAPMVLSHIVV